MTSYVVNVAENSQETVDSTPHLARVTHANTFSCVTQAELTLRSLHCFVSFRKLVILIGMVHVARAMFMA